MRRPFGWRTKYGGKNMKELINLSIDVANLNDIKKNIKNIIAHHITSRVGVVLNEHNVFMNDEMYDSVHTEMMITLTSLNLSQ